MKKPEKKKVPVRKAVRVRVEKKPLPKMPLLPPCDFSEAMERMGGNLALLTQVHAIFLEEIPKMIHAMKGHAKKKNYHGLWNEAHKMKGASSHFGALEMIAILQQIEEAASQKKSKNLDPLFQYLGQGVSNFKAHSKKWELPPGGGVIV
ncbi:MAG: Hpt domain-containing protein [Gemmataceae bacterium]|nr:Hpt domain-containing protein [Gemmataceae bacterium]